jgi:hypothetical protein
MYLSDSSYSRSKSGPYVFSVPQSPLHTAVPLSTEPVIIKGRMFLNLGHTLRDPALPKEVELARCEPREDNVAYEHACDSSLHYRRVLMKIEIRVQNLLESFAVVHPLCYCLIEEPRSDLGSPRLLPIE